VSPGAHRLLIRHPAAFDADYRMDIPPTGAGLAAELWRRDPLASRVRPTFPGATVAGAAFLRDGRVALTVALPPDDDRQAWLLDPATGALERVGPPGARAGLAVAPDGQRIAYLATSTRGAVGGLERLDEVWLAGVGAARGERVWRLPAPEQRLVDLAWAPDGAHLLAVSAESAVGGGSRSHLLWLDLAAGQARELVALPSEVVPGSYAWSPDGRRAAFLARSGTLAALCLVDADGGFRYLADLSRDDSSPLPIPPVAWSEDGRGLIYAAPTQDRSGPTGWLWGGGPAIGLFALEPDRPVGQRLGTAQGQSPVRRRDGLLLALARPKGDGPLVLRQVDPDGTTRDLGRLPLTPSSTYAARWDAAHAQALVATRAPASLGATRPQYWLLRFDPEARR
jgi:dipeptidyl aminopeptidase/acylaminoacyl peptidase